jgi:hypothetical protein
MRNGPPDTPAGRFCAYYWVLLAYYAAAFTSAGVSEMTDSRRFET